MTRVRVSHDDEPPPLPGRDRGPAHPGGAERRASPRIAAEEHRAWLAWSDGGRVVVVKGRLVDISGGGLAMLLGPGRSPAAGQEVTFCLRVGSPDCLQGRVLERVGGTADLIRVAFHEDCPDRLLRAARGEGSGGANVGSGEPD